MLEIRFYLIKFMSEISTINIVTGKYNVNI